MEQLSGEVKKIYWDLVLETMVKVFNMKEKEAAKRLNHLKRKINRLRQSTQMLFYHSAPLSVASDLACIVPSKNQLRKYLKLEKGFDFNTDYETKPPNEAVLLLW